MKVYHNMKLTLLVLAILLSGNILAQVTADFTSNVTSGCSLPFQVQFTDQSTTVSGTITSRIWDFGNGTGSTSANPTASYTQPGVYNVRLIARNSLNERDTILKTSLITVVGTVVVTSTITDATCYNCPDGAIDISVSGGTPPYTYLWSNASTTEDQSGLEPGTYNVTVTESGGCSTALTNLKIAVICTPITVSLALDNPLACSYSADGVLRSTTIGGRGPYGYVWDDPNYVNPCQPGGPPCPPGPPDPDTLAGVSAGLYGLTVYDQDGCTGTGTILITAPDPVVVSVSITNATCLACSDGLIMANASGGTPPYVFSIDGGLNFQASNIFSGLPSGTYTIACMDFNACMTSTNGVVVDTACAHSTIAQSIVDADCNGAPTGQIVLNTTGGVSPYSYLWNNATVGSALSNVPAGTYVVQTTDITGCSSLDTFTILEPTTVVGTVITNDVACFGGNDGTAQLIASGGNAPYAYSWQGRAPYTLYDTIQNLSPGSYAVTITDFNGCEYIEPFTIGQPTALNVATTSIDASCPTCNDGSITANVTGGTAPYTYVWGTTPVRTVATAASLSPGIYAITVQDSKGCVAFGFDTVKYNCNLTVDLGSDTAVCFGVFNFNPTITGGTAPYTALWSTGEMTTTIITSTPDTYILQVTDQNTCTASDTMILSDANPSATVSDDTTICLGASVQLFAAGGISYDWTGGAVSNNNVANPTTTPMLTSLYFVEIDNGTCVSVRDVLVTVETDCTWPGDADNSGLVDNDDVLAIGIGYGDTGPLRSFASLVWEGQRGNSWTNSLLSGTNYKHIDTDGNGTIDDEDTLAISLNYGLSHPKSQVERDATMPMIFIDLPDSVSAGQTVQGQIYLGSDSFPLANIYGIKFSMSYNTDFVEENTMSFNFGPSWMGTPGTDLLTFQKDLYSSSRIDGAVTGINHVNRAGFGIIGMANFTMKDDISGKDLLALPMLFEFTNIRAIDASEGLIDVAGDETTTIATQEVVGIGSVQSNLPVAIYPNPAQNVLFINTYGETLNGIQVRNILGEAVTLPMAINAGMYSINTENLAAGVYIITIQSQNHVAIERIVINK